RRAADAADGVRRHAKDLALLRNQHQLVVVADLRDADNLAIAIARLDIDDADAAARLHAVLVEPGPLAVTLLGHRQDRAARLEHFHGDDFVVISELDAANTACRASHRANVGFFEPNRHAIARANEDLAVAVREL